MCKSMDFGRNLDYPGRNALDTGWTCKLHTESVPGLRIKPVTLLWGDHAALKELQISTKINDEFNGWTEVFFFFFVKHLKRVNPMSAYFAPILRCQCFNIFLTPKYKLRFSCSFPQVQVWDTAGQERFRKSMVEHYYRNVHAVVFVYDVTKMASFRNLQTWIEVGIR